MRKKEANMMKRSFTERTINDIRTSKAPVTLLHHDLVDAVGGGVAMRELTKITNEVIDSHDVKYCEKKGEWTFTVKS